MTADFDPFLDWWRAWYYDDAPVADVVVYQPDFDPERDCAPVPTTGSNAVPAGHRVAGDEFTARIAALYRAELAKKREVIG